MSEQWDRAADGWNAHGPQIGAWLARATDGMLGMARNGFSLYTF